MNELHVVYKIILGIMLLYIAGFFIWCPIGLLMEHAIKGARKESILMALDAGLDVSYSEAEFREALHELSTHTLGSVIDEMVRSKSIIRTAILEPTPRWQITRHPQQC